VVRLLAAGHPNAEIARELFVSPRTVHTHVSNALRKTNCSNRTELAVLAVQDRAGTPPVPDSVLGSVSSSTGARD
jgi:DNA-binding NarL/FixJ family response regulator